MRHYTRGWHPQATHNRATGRTGRAGTSARGRRAAQAGAGTSRPRTIAPRVGWPGEEPARRGRRAAQAGAGTRRPRTIARRAAQAGQARAGHPQSRHAPSSARGTGRGRNQQAEDGALHRQRQEPARRGRRAAQAGAGTRRPRTIARRAVRGAGAAGATRGACWSWLAGLGRGRTSRHLGLHRKTQGMSVQASDAIGALQILLLLKALGRRHQGPQELPINLVGRSLQ